MISGAYQNLKLANGLSATTTPCDLTQYMNYVSIDTSGAQIDNIPSAGALNCNAASPCIRLHNGGAMNCWTLQSFNGTAATNAVWMEFDPDGRVTGNSSGEAVEFWLYYNGRLRTGGTIEANTVNSQGTYSADPSWDPAWFDWN
jgi:hypothetical protein